MHFRNVLLNVIFSRAIKIISHESSVINTNILRRMLDGGTFQVANYSYHIRIFYLLLTSIAFYRQVTLKYTNIEFLEQTTSSAVSSEDQSLLIAKWGLKKKCMVNQNKGKKAGVITNILDSYS